MRKLSIVLFLLYFLTNLAFSQSGWLIQNSWTYENLNGVFFPYDVNNNNSSGFVVGNAGIVIKTTNSGINWLPVSFPVGTNNLCVTFKNPQHGFVGSQNGKIYSTTNFGINWIEHQTGTVHEVNSIMFSPSGNIGWAGNYYSNLFKTLNGGANWTILTSFSGYNLKVFCLDDYRLWAVNSYGYVYRTTNSGINFSFVRPVTSQLRAIQFVTSTIGYVAGDSGKILKSTDGGATFALLNSGISLRLNSIAAIDPFNIWIAGNNGLLLKTTNGGINWTQYYYTNNNLNNISFISGTSYGYCTGDFGTILRTIEAPGSGGIGNGTNLIPIPFSTAFSDGRSDMLYYSSELSSLTGYSSVRINSIGFNISIVNSQPINGLEIKMQSTTQTSLSSYTSSGWTTVYSGVWTPPGTGVRYINLQTPFVWSSPMNLLVEVCFNNSSGTVNSEVLSTTTTNYTVFYNATNQGGLNGCIDILGGTAHKIRPNLFIRWYPIPTGVGGNFSSVPKEFKLYQNYPNPFNPSTNIRYYIPKKSFVSLKIYDILGKEVTTLINEDLKAGEYIASFSGAHLSSGIYFYRLTADAYSNTKKMILIK